MKLSDIENKLSTLSADASSIQVLTTEVSEMLDPNSSDYFKLHTVYELCENQMRLIEDIDDVIVELK